MKKIVYMIMSAMIATFLLPGCSSQDNSVADSSSVAVDTPSVSQSADGEDKSSAPEGSPKIGVGSIVYDKNDMVIRQGDIDYDYEHDKNKIHVYLEVENNRKEDKVMVSAAYAKVNGTAIAALRDFYADPGETTTNFIEFNKLLLKAAGIEEIGTIELDLQFELNHRRDYDLDDSISLVYKEGVPNAPLVEGHEVLNHDGMVITYFYIKPDNPGIYDYTGMYFQVQNNSDKTQNVGLKMVSINGEDRSGGGFWLVVTPGAHGIAFPQQYYEETMKEIGVQFELRDDKHGFMVQPRYTSDIITITL